LAQNLLQLYASFRYYKNLKLNWMIPSKIGAFDATVELSTAMRRLQIIDSVASATLLTKSIGLCEGRFGRNNMAGGEKESE
jgi:hypothetical protein